MQENRLVGSGWFWLKALFLKRRTWLDFLAFVVFRLLESSRRLLLFDVLFPVCPVDRRRVVSAMTLQLWCRWLGHMSECVRRLTLFEPYGEIHWFGCGFKSSMVFPVDLVEISGLSSMDLSVGIVWWWRRYGVLFRCVPAKLVAVLHLFRLTLAFGVPIWWSADACLREARASTRG